MKKQKNKNFILVVSGVSGAGKSAVLDSLQRQPDLFCTVASYTTRPKRPGEFSYERKFITDEEFDQAIKNGEFFEWETVHQYRYGRKKADITEALNSGKILYMEIDVKGMSKLKKSGLDMVSVFIMAPSVEEAISRVRKRGESDEDVQIRKDRYKMEMSYKDKYDYILVNDNLDHAREELLDIIDREKQNRHNHNNFKNILLTFAFLFTFTACLGFLGAQFYLSNTKAEPKVVIQMQEDKQQSDGGGSVDAGDTPAASVATSTPPPAEVKNTIVKEPPKHEAAKTSKIASSETVQNDGSKTVVINTAGDSSASSVNFSTLANNQVSVPSDIVFDDETGAHSDLGPIVKNYLTNTLKWKNEISAMKEITLKDAGKTNWCGLYNASYNVSASGHISDVIGTITLNANSSCFYNNAAIFNDYMKLYFSHEYGHHYTLYHKWIDLNIPVDQRFPDEYYTLRPLNKVNTATDYSLGWENCEAEIIAEDYSYFYSGYGFQAMHDNYGLALPSDLIRGWLDDLGSSIQAQAVQVANVAPTLSIINPQSSAVLSSSFDFQVDANDDNKVSKVTFYIDDKQVTAIYRSPFAISINPSNYATGTHTLKAVASDGTLETTKEISVTFVDQDKPELSILSPTSNPYEWTTGNLEVELSVKDNYSVDKVEVYLKDKLFGSWSNEKKETIKGMTLNFTIDSLPKGDNTLVIKAYDASGNVQELNFIVNKQ